MIENQSNSDEEQVEKRSINNVREKEFVSRSY